MFDFLIEPSFFFFFYNILKWWRGEMQGLMWLFFKHLHERHANLRQHGKITTHHVHTLPICIPLCDWQATSWAPHLIKNPYLIPAVSQDLNINTGRDPPHHPPSQVTWWKEPANELHHYGEALTGDGGMRDRWGKLGEEQRGWELAEF